MHHCHESVLAIIKHHESVLTNVKHIHIRGSILGFSTRAISEDADMPLMDIGPWGRVYVPTGRHGADGECSTERKLLTFVDHG